MYDKQHADTDFCRPEWWNKQKTSEKKQEEKEKKEKKKTHTWIIWNILHWNNYNEIEFHIKFYLDIN